jgi:UPF0716 protein FxsA
VPILALIALFVIVPLAELYVIFQVVGPALGAPLTIALLAADSLAGAWLMKSQGRAVWRRFNETMAAGKIPHREIVDGVLVIFGGAFLITPGFITDILGFLLLIPPTRSLFRRSLQRRLERRSATVVRDAAAGRYRRPVDYDVEGTATEHEPPPGSEPGAPELPPPGRTRRPRP